MWRGGIPRWAAIATGLAAMLAFPAAAPAAKKPGKSPKVKTRTSTSSGAGNGAIISTTAVCPSKHRAVGGGFQQTAPTTGAQGLVYESVKSGQAGWRVSTQILDQMAPVDPITLTAYAYCRKIVKDPVKRKRGWSPPKTATSSATATSPAADLTGPTVQAICSKGRQAMAGGFATSPPILGATARPIVLDSLRSGSRSWQTLVLSGATKTGDVTSLAYCAKDVKAPGTVSAVSAANAAPFTDSRAVATCPPKKRPVHGGFSQTAATPNNLVLVYESRAAGNDWLVAGTHAGSLSSTVGSTAYCA